LKEKAKETMEPVDCGLIVAQITEADAMAARWVLTGDSTQLAAAHASFRALSQSNAPGVGRYGECALGGLYSRNASYPAAYRMLESCVAAAPTPPGLTPAARGGCLGELWRRADGSADAWEAARWEASHAGQLGRLLMRFNQVTPVGRAGLGDTSPASDLTLATPLRKPVGCFALRTFVRLLGVG
jgi:hypothetical protein